MSKSIEVYSYSNNIFPFWIPITYSFTIADVRDMISSYLQSFYKGRIDIVDKDGCVIEYLCEKDRLYFLQVDYLYID